MKQNRPTRAIRSLIAELTSHEIAKALKVTRQAVEYWGNRGVTAEHVRGLVALSKTSKRPREPWDFRPDIYPPPEPSSAQQAEQQDAQPATADV